MARERDYSKFPLLAEWLKSEEDRNRLIEWLDSSAKLEGSWMRDDRLGLEFRIELYGQHLLSRGWSTNKITKEQERLLEYIKKWD